MTVTDTAKSVIRRAALALGYKIERVPAAHKFIRRAGELDPSILPLVRSHLRRANTTPELPLGDRWGAYATRLRSQIERMSSIDELILYGQSPAAGVETSHFTNILQTTCEAIDLQMRDDLPTDLWQAFPSFCAPQIAIQDCLVDYCGTTLDHVTLCAAHNILTLLDLLKSDRP
jgi:hypothetical protein